MTVVRVQAAWMLKMRALTEQLYVDEVDMDEEGIAETLMDNNAIANVPRPGTSLKQPSTGTGAISRGVRCDIHVKYTGWPKKMTPFLYALTLPNINRFSQLFHGQIQEKICNNTITRDPTTPQVCRYTTL